MYREDCQKADSNLPPARHRECTSARWPITRLLHVSIRRLYAKHVSTTCLRNGHLFRQDQSGEPRHPQVTTRKRRLRLSFPYQRATTTCHRLLPSKGVVWYVPLQFPPFSLRRQRPTSTTYRPLPNTNVTERKGVSSEGPTCPTSKARFHFPVKHALFLRIQVIVPYRKRTPHVTNVNGSIPPTPLFPSLYKPNAR